MSKQFFFILGRGRSGSWLLKSILSAHPEICCAPEALFIIHTQKRYGHVISFTENQIRSFVDDIWLEARLPMWWKLDKNELTEDLLKNATGKSFSAVCMEVYAYYAGKNGNEGATVLGDKNPTYTLFIKELAELFPNAKFIALVRDYRDNILSYQQVGFDLQSTSALSGRWNDFHREILKYSKELSNRFMIVKYEELLLQPEKNLTNICSFLGVQFLPAMLEFYKDPKNVLAWNEKIKNPIDPNSAYKWKSKMPASEIEKADYICGDLAKNFGYERQSNKGGLSFWLKTLRGRIRSANATFLERLIFKLPMKMRMNILNSYRKRSGTLGETGD